MCRPRAAGACQLEGRPAAGTARAAPAGWKLLTYSALLCWSNCSRHPGLLGPGGGWAKTVGRPAGSTHHGSAAKGTAARCKAVGGLRGPHSQRLAAVMSWRRG